MNTSSYKVDLHTHSIISYDGGLTEGDYSNILKKNILDFIAVTDHNEISFALFLQKKLGSQIIVGEEIRTKNGEIIGLFLSKKIPPQLSIKDAIEEIKSQGGLVYIPHPFEMGRESISLAEFEKHIKNIDIIESFNARSFGRKKTEDVQQVLKSYKIPQASSSDAHCLLGVATGYTITYNRPTKESLRVSSSYGDLHMKYAPIISYLCPFVNKIKHTLSL